MIRFMVTAAVAWIMAGAGFADPFVPADRFVVIRGIDYFGEDLQPQFDTNLQACQRACSAQSDCAGFTFNSRANACFPKRAINEGQPYDGAISAQRVSTPASVLAAAADRAVAIGFLGDRTLTQARDQAISMALAFPADGRRLDDVLAAAQARRTEGAARTAMRWMGIAVVLSDTSEVWAEFARDTLAVSTDDWSERRRLERRALSAAANAYLRAGSRVAQTNALDVLAQALERRNRGRDMVRTLRLATDLSPRADLNEALDRAIAKYGFRVVETQVDSDAAAPRICATFSEPVAEGIDLSPYVRRVDDRLAVTAEGRQVCVEGIAHGTRYEITLRSGLPSSDPRESLHRDVTLRLYVRDRQPQVRFPGRTYVLPKTSDAGLPVVTVNAETLTLSLRRVSDRNLLRAVQDGYFGRPLSRYSEGRFAEEIAETVWTGIGETGNELNRDMTTRLPMGAAIADLPAGIYALSAAVPGVDPFKSPAATQWFVLSDLGISTLQGTDGLHVTVRRLADAGPAADTEVTVLSRANRVLARAMTDADGYAFVPAAGSADVQAGSAPALVLAARGESDIGFLSLTDPAFDLSDRGVAGRVPPGPMDVFLTTDRGAYRAGETIHATALLRDTRAMAVADVPLSARLVRPDGVEYARRVSGGQDAGGHVFSFPLGNTVPRGTWRLETRVDPDAPALTSQVILVEDFLPERIDFDLSLPDTGLRLGDRPPLRVEAHYLFGAPGADLPIEGQVTLRAGDSLPQWPGFRFGRYDQPVAPQTVQVDPARTDAAGVAVLPLSLPAMEEARQPLSATVTMRVSEGSGRPVERQLVVPVSAVTPMIGIRPEFDGVLPQGGEAQFALIGLGPDASPADMAVRWTLNRVETRYQWYQLYGDWNWEPTTTRSRIAQGETTLGTAPVPVAAPVDWGRYELVVERSDGVAYTASAVDFYAGWYAPADGSATPDTLSVSLDRPNYRVGDTAMLRIVPRQAGTVLLSVMRDDLIERQAIEVDAEPTQIPLSVTEAWGSGAYVAATLITPLDANEGLNPTRSVGIAHATVAPDDKQLRVTLDVPDIQAPRSTLRAGITVDGVAEGETAWLTLAAVDVGILNLTSFDAPDPSAHYFGQRRLGVEMRDMYGRLIDGMSGAMGRIRSGGDASGQMRRESPPPTEDLMAVFEGPVEVGPDGRAFVNVPLPTFNGTVRFMAVAWSPRAVGQASADVTVRDPVVATLSVPRFLAPGDESRMLVELIHADGPAGEVGLSLSASGFEIDRTALPEKIMLASGATARFAVPIRAEQIGDHDITLTVSPPSGEVLTKTLRMPVRLNDPVVATTRRFSLGAGRSFLLNSDAFAGLQAGSGRVVVSAGPLARFDAPGLLTALDRYPYGCTEQVTSRALPLLYLSDMAEAAGLGARPDLMRRVAEAVDVVLSRQAPNGGFGLWRAQSGEVWLDAYVTDFLSRARAEGIAVPDLALRQALDNLRNRVAFAPDFDRGGDDIAYALLVLAREGAAAMGDLRYYADAKATAFESPLALAQMGAALALYGDQLRADRLFRLAQDRLNRATSAESPVWRGDFGSNLRDAAGVLRLAVSARSEAVDIAALTARITTPGRPLSTQEAAWSLLAAESLASDAGTPLRVNDQPVTGPFVQVMQDAADLREFDIANAGNTATDLTVTTFGVPSIAPAAGGVGYAVSRSYFTTDGVQVSGPVAVGTRLVTVLRVTSFDDSGAARLMIDDPLPAGFEIDNPRLLQSGDIRDLGWLRPSFAEHAEFRSDRFLAAVDHRGGAPITLAYVVRAVSPGSFHHPAVSVEDMYRPQYRARGETGRLTVTP